MNILVTGKNGQLGSEIQLLSKNAPATFFFVGSEDGDITNKAILEQLIRVNKIDTIINCAAYTAVDKAEEDREAAFAVNKTGVQNLVELCEIHGVRLLHISTDYVFDGKGTAPYRTDNPIAPIGVYGASKQAGEAAIMSSTIPAIIIRTSWVFSSFGKNFVKTMLLHGAQKDDLNVVNDQTGSPTYARDLADACLKIALETSWNTRTGIYHFCNSGAITWCTFAQEIMEQAKLPCHIHPIPTSAYPTPAKRPSYSVLDCSRIEKDFGITPRSWKMALRDCLHAIQEQ